MGLAASSGAFFQETPLLWRIFISFVLHVFVIFIIPFVVRTVWKPKVFMRPATFQLVAMPKYKSLAEAAKTAKASQKKAANPIPAQSKRIQSKKTKDEPVQQEDISDLEDLLNAVKAPVSDIMTGGAFPYAWYIRNVMNKVETQWRPPIENPDASVTVTFTIFSNGSISHVKVLKSSGIQLVDNSALRAIEAAAPFGKLPATFTSDELEINYVLRPTRK